jgi:hypothetical protein
MANKRPLIITGSQLGNLEVGDALVNPVGVAYATAFTTLSDAPNTYAGQAGKFLRVNLTANGLEFTAGGGGGGSLPLDEIGFGTGSSITSSPDLTYDPLTGHFALTPPTTTTPGDIDIESSSSVPFVAPPTSGILDLNLQTASTQASLQLGWVDWITGNEPTNLLNTAQVYSVTVTVDGVPTLLSDVGSNLQTYNDIFNILFFAAPPLNPSFNPFAPPIVVAQISSNVVGSGGTVTFTEAGPGLGLITSLISSIPGFTATTSSPGTDGQTTFTTSDPTGITGSHSDDIVVDGVTHNVTVTDVNAATIGTLTSQLNTQLSGFATVVFDSISKITITSLTTGVTSTVTSPQNDLLQTPGPITPLFSIQQTPGSGPIVTQNPSGAVNISSNHRILENSAEIYELLGTTGATPTPLLTADGTEIPLELLPVTLGNSGAGVFEILAIGHIPGPPAGDGCALSIRGGWDLGGLGISSVKEEYIIGGGTLDVTLGPGDVLRVTASGDVGIVWKCRVVVIQLPGSGSV